MVSLYLLSTCTVESNPGDMIFHVNIIVVNMKEEEKTNQDVQYTCMSG